MKFLNILRELSTFNVPLIFFFQLLFAICSYDSMATPSFVLVCHQETKEELCQRYLNQHKEAISYTDYLESSTGLLSRALFLRINQFLELYYKIPVGIYPDTEKASSYFAKKTQMISSPHFLSIPPNDLIASNGPLNEIHQELVNDLTQGFLSPIKKAILLHLLTLQLKGATLPSSLSNSSPATQEISLTKPLLARDWVLQIKTLRDGPFSHPGTLSPHFVLPNHTDRIYINGILIHKEQLNRIQLHRHIYYHVAYISNTYQPRFQWAMGEKLQIFDANVPISEGDCSNSFWRARETDYAMDENEKIKVLYPSNCVAQMIEKVSVSNFKNEANHKLNSSISAELKKEFLYSTQPPTTADDLSKTPSRAILKNTWHEHPLIIWGSSLLALYFISKQKPSDSH